MSGGSLRTYCLAYYLVFQLLKLSQFHLLFYLLSCLSAQLRLEVIGPGRRMKVTYGLMGMITDRSAVGSGVPAVHRWCGPGGGRFVLYIHKRLVFPGSGLRKLRLPGPALLPGQSRLLPDAGGSGGEIPQPSFAPGYRVFPLPRLPWSMVLRLPGERGHSRRPAVRSSVRSHPAR